MNNTTGLGGVYEVHCYVANWVDSEGKIKSKKFKISDFPGAEEALDAAKAYRQQKIAELNEQGAGYTERHGT